MTSSREPSDPPDARVLWAGHATVRLSLDGEVLLTDPLLVPTLGRLVSRVVPVPPGVTDGVSAVLVSHLHRDHLSIASLRRIDPAVTVLAPAGARPLLARAGMRNVVEMLPGDVAAVGAVSVRATPAAHDGGGTRPRGPRGGHRPHATALGFVIAGSRSVYFPGDTAVFDGMSSIGGDLDLALLPVGGWGPNLGPGHMDAAEAVAALGLLRPRAAIPIHWGTYMIRWEALRRDAVTLGGERFARLAARDAPGVHVHLLRPGEAVTLPPGARAGAAAG